MQPKSCLEILFFFLFVWVILTCSHAKDCQDFGERLQNPNHQFRIKILGKKIFNNKNIVVIGLLERLLERKYREQVQFVSRTVKVRNNLSNYIIEALTLNAYKRVVSEIDIDLE